MIACTKSYVKPDISCPDPVLRQVSITDDKSILEALNLITEAYLAEKLQVDCYKKTLKWLLLNSYHDPALAPDPDLDPDHDPDPDHDLDHDHALDPDHDLFCFALHNEIIRSPT